MITKFIAAALLSTALMTGVAAAQTADTNKSDSATSSATTHKDGEWRASKLVGVDVYNEANDKLGDINEVIFDKSGKVTNVIIGVGGFLGLGEHYVAVAFDKLKWIDEEPARTATSSTTSSGAPATNADSDKRTASDGSARTTNGSPTSTAKRSANEAWYPNHAVYNATKDQLKDMPEFKY